jgi:hypothetical protein
MADSRLEASIRYATYFLSGVVLLAVGVSTAATQIANLLPCATPQGGQCPTSFLNSQAAALVCELVLVVVSMVLFLMARNLRRKLLPDTPTSDPPRPFLNP